MQKTLYIPIDTTLNFTFECPLLVKKYDTLKLKIAVFNTGLLKDISNQTVDIILRKKDGTNIEKNVTDKTLNIASVVLDKQATAYSGEVEGEVILTDSTGQTTTNTFVFNVSNSLTEDIQIKSEDSIDTLQDMRALMATYKEEIQALGSSVQATEALINIKNYIDNNLAALTNKNVTASVNIDSLKTENNRADSNIPELKNENDNADDKLDKFRLYDTTNLIQQVQDNTASLSDMVQEQATQNADIASKSNQIDLNTEIIDRTNAVSNEKTERQAEIAVERARINSFTALAAGSTTGDAELIDARVGADGSNFQNAGTSIRKQISAITDRTTFNSTYLVSELLKSANMTQGKFYGHTATSVSNVGDSATWCIFSPIRIFAGIKYYLKSIGLYFTIALYDDGTHSALTESSSPNSSDMEFTTTKNGYLLVTVTLSSWQAQNAMLSNGVPKWKKYNENNCYMIGKIRDVDIIPTNIINVKKDGTGDFTSLVTAIQSITDSSATNQYTVNIYDNHDILTELGGQTYCDSITSPDGRKGLIIPSYVTLVGMSTGAKVTLSCEYLSTWAYNYNAISSLSTLEIIEGNVTLKNISVTAKNCRYAVHDEKSGGNLDTYRKHENCNFIHYGNDDFSNQTQKWLSVCAYGMGTASGQTGNWNGCTFISKSFRAFLCHDNTNFSKGAIIQFDNCEFINQGGNIDYLESLRVSSYGTGEAINNLILNNNILQSIQVANEASTANKNRWRVTGGGNSNHAIAENIIDFPIVINI